MQVGLRLVPDTQTFISLLLAKEESYESLNENMQALVLLSVPLLEDIHCALVHIIFAVILLWDTMD